MKQATGPLSHVGHMVGVRNDGGVNGGRDPGRRGRVRDDGDLEADRIARRKGAACR